MKYYLYGQKKSKNYHKLKMINFNRSCTKVFEEDFYVFSLIIKKNSFRVTNRSHKY